MGVQEGCETSPDMGYKTVCIWSYKGYRTYTVKNVNYPMNLCCGGIVESGEMRLMSPLAGEQVSGFWCGYDNNCYDRGWEEWMSGYYYL